MEPLIIILLVVLFFGIPIYYNWKKRKKHYKLGYIESTPHEEDFWFMLFRHHQPNKIYNIDKAATQIARAHCRYLMDLEVVTKENGHANFPKRSKALMDAGALDVAEIVGVNITTEDLYNDFMDSPSHKKIIDNKKFNAVGLGIIEDERGALYCTVLFFKV